MDGDFSSLAEDFSVAISILGWTREDFWKANPREYYCCRTYYAKNMGFIKTIKDHERELEQNGGKPLTGSEAINALCGFMGNS